MHFAQPTWLWALAVWPAVVWLVFAGLRRENRRLAQLADPFAWTVMLPARRPGRRRMAALLQVGALACGLIALARPQWGFHWDDVRTRGLQVMVVLDTSRSMLAGDLKPDRLQRAKWGIRDLAARLGGDRLGLIAFAGSAFLQCPLTSDSAAFLMTLEDVYAGLVPRGGTSLAAALRKALEAFRQDTEADSVIVLLSDGEDHEGGWETVTDELKRRRIRVFSVGVGTPPGELIPIPESGPGPAPGWLQDREGQPVLSRLQEGPLEALALATGGLYVRATPGDLGMDRIADRIQGLKRAELGDRRVRIAREQYGWFVGAALFLLILEALGTGRLSRSGASPGETPSQEAAT
jgi:Ca-activated chloride channel family protein